MAKRADFIVIGLGRFGSAAAEGLVALGQEVIGVDASDARVQHHMNLLGQVVQANGADLDAMRQVGAGDVGTALIAMGSDIEASILAASVMLEIGVPRVWAKAVTSRHGAILERIGAHRVIYPERDMGDRVAHALVGRALDFVMLDPRFAMAETTVPPSVSGKGLAEAGIRSRHDVTVVCVKKPGGDYTPATAETVIEVDDELLVVGEAAKVEAFTRLD